MFIATPVGDPSANQCKLAGADCALELLVFMPGNWSAGLQ